MSFHYNLKTDLQEGLNAAAKQMSEGGRNVVPAVSHRSHILLKFKIM